MLAALVLAATIGQMQETPAHQEQRLAWFRAARVGMFIHWGPVSQKGTEIGWSRGQEVPVEEYDNLYKTFDPTQFDAEAWMKLAAQAGFKYVVPTAKHHDGFCLWPSKQTDYTIAHTPFKRDVMGAIAAAAKKHGLAMCSYYSILDWHNPLYPTGSPGGTTMKPRPDMPAYMKYVKVQLTELVKNYHLKMLWFDGQWEHPYTMQMATDLRQFLWNLDPALVVNDRIGKGGTGDYDTPEQRVGGFQRGRAWETCMTLCTQWAWKPDDRMKSLPEVLHILVETVTGDGNLLLNVGPMPDGRIEPRQADRLRELGAWLKKYGSSVYGTRGGPWKNGAWGGATCKGKEVYVHLLDWKGGRVAFQALPAKVRKVECLTPGTVKLATDLNFWTLTGESKGETDTIVRLTLDKDAYKLGVFRAPG